MLTKIKTGANLIERQKFIREADRMISEYGWQDKVVHPWSYPIKITSIIDDLRDYDSCTIGSKHQIISLVNGLADILNEWEKVELEPKVMYNGKLIPESVAELMKETTNEAKNYERIQRTYPDTVGREIWD